MSGRMRKPLVVAFDQDTNKEIEAVEAPSWAKGVYIETPTLDSCTLTVMHSLDGETWATREFDFNATANPRSTFTGGRMLLFDTEGFTFIKVVSSVEQAGKSVKVFFKDQV